MEVLLIFSASDIGNEDANGDDKVKLEAGRLRAFRDSRSGDGVVGAKLRYLGGDTIEPVGDEKGYWILLSWENGEGFV